MDPEEVTGRRRRLEEADYPRVSQVAGPTGNEGESDHLLSRGVGWPAQRSAAAGFGRRFSAMKHARALWSVGHRPHKTQRSGGSRGQGLLEADTEPRRPGLASEGAADIRLF